MINQINNDSKKSKIVDLVIKYSGGIIKDEKQAEYLLLSFAVLCIIFSLFLFLNINKQKTGVKILPNQDSMYPSNPINPPKHLQ